MSRWDTLPAADFCLSVRDGTHDSPKPVISGRKLITSKHMTSGRLDLSSAYLISDAEFIDINRRSKVDQWDVLISMIGTVGEVYLERNDPIYAIKNIGLFKSRSEWHGRWLYYFLQSPAARAELFKRCRGTTQLYVPLGELRAFPVRFPVDEIERRAIIETLSSLDDKIELNRRMNETLEAMAQAIFRDWFVDFGPTRRKLEGATDPVTIMGGLVTDPARAQELADLFPATLGDDALPEGWETRVVGDLLEDSIGGDWGSEVPEGQSNHRIAVIRGTDLPAILAGGIGAVPYRYTTSKKAQRRTLKSDDIVIEVSGGSPKQPTGRSMLMTQSILDRFDSDVVCASFCRRFRPLSPRASILLSVHLSALYADGGTWKYQNQSTGISNFQTTLFLETERVSWGGEVIAGAFESLVRPMIERTRTNENMALAATRDLLLPKLMSGEIRLGEAEELVEAAQ